MKHMRTINVDSSAGIKLVNSGRDRDAYVEYLRYEGRPKPAEAKQESRKRRISADDDSGRRRRVIRRAARPDRFSFQSFTR